MGYFANKLTEFLERVEWDPQATAVTRFSAAEYQMLTEQAQLQGMDQHQLLNWCVAQQILKAQDQVPMSGEVAEHDRQQAEESLKALASDQQWIRQEIDQSVVLFSDDQQMNSQQQLAAQEYGRRVGCRTAMGARRHAFVAQMVEQGLLPPNTPLPRNFTGSVV